MVLLAQLAGLAGQGLFNLLPFGDIEQNADDGGLAEVVDAPPVQLDLQGFPVLMQGTEAGVDIARVLLARVHQLGDPGAVLGSGKGV